MLSLLHTLSPLGTDKDPHFPAEETEAWGGVVILVMYPTVVIFAQGWYLLGSKTDKQDISFTEDLWLHVPSPRCGNTLPAESGWSDGRGFPGSHLQTDPATPKEGKQPTLEICRGKAQVTLSYEPSLLTKKKTKVF